MITLPQFVGRLASAFAARRSSPQQQVMVNLLDMWARNRPLADLWDVKKFVNEAYRRNTLVFACVKNLATSFSQPPMRAYTVDNQEQDTALPRAHMLARLLEHPNLRQSQREFFREFSTHVDVAGNVYVYKVRSAAGIVVQLRLLRPDLVRPVPDDNGEIARYDYGNQPNVQSVPAIDVIHERCDPDPLDPYRGLSPIAVLSRMGDLDNFAADYLRAFFLNGGIPSIALKYKKTVGPDEITRTQQLWHEKYSGLNGWNNVAVLDGDLDVEEIGSKIRTMDLAGIFGQTESRICSVYGTPPIIVGAWVGLVHATYANYGSARKSFYQETMLPKWASAQDRFTVDLAHEFGENLRCKFDVTEIDALQEEKAEARKFAIDGWDKGLLKKNEARKLAGFDADDEAEDGEEYKSAPVVPLLPDDDMDEPVVMALPRARARFLLGMGDRFDAAREAEWKLLHRIADSSAPAVKKKILLAIAKTQDGTVLADVEKAIADRNIDAAMDAIPWSKLEELSTDLSEDIRNILERSAKAAERLLPDDVPIKFDVTNPEAVKWVREHAGELVTDVVDSSKESIRGIIGKSFTEGIAPRDAAKLIKEHIGLLPKHSAAVENYRAELLADGRSQADADRLAGKYSAKLLKYRAEMIARHETMTAANHGQRELWKQGIADGDLVATEWEREWIVTPDSRLCPICEPLEGATAPMDGTYPGDGGIGPPAHVVCRCVESLIRRKALRAAATRRGPLEAHLLKQVVA